MPSDRKFSLPTWAQVIIGLVVFLGALSSLRGYVADWLSGSSQWSELETRIEQIEDLHKDDTQWKVMHEGLPLEDVHKVPDEE